MRRIGAITAEPDRVDDPPSARFVCTDVTATVVVPARHARPALGHYADITPGTAAAPIHQLHAHIVTIRRTPLRRRHHR